MRVLILAESDDLANPAALPLREFDAVVLAFWASPEFAARLVACGARACWRLNDFVPAYGERLRLAFEMAHGLALRAPSYRDVNPLQAWENVLATALFVPLVMAEVYTKLRERDADVELNFISRNDTQRAFETLNQRAPLPCTVRALHDVETSKAHLARGRLGAFLDLLGEARRAGDWSNAFWVPLETLDAQYRWRSRFDRQSKAHRGGPLFYSSYINFSRALTSYLTSYEKPYWVVNSHSARRGLPNETTAANLWQFGAPRTTEHQVARKAIREMVAKAPESQNGFPLRAVLATSREVQETLAHVMPLLLAEIDLMHACLERVQPDELWVANQWGGEGCFIQAAHTHGIPVTQVQHGVLEEYFACAPIYTEQFLVWNEFARDIISPATRPVVKIAPPGNGDAPDLTDAPIGDRITFFSAPPQIVALWNPSVVRWETVTLLHAFTECGQAVTLRAHPLDQLDEYARVWQANYGALPDKLALNKGTPLALVLKDTKRGVMSFSTVVLDCAARGIPVTGLGWYEFMLRRAVEQAGYITYADTMEMVLAQCVS